MSISQILIPLIILGIFLYGFGKKTDIFSSFSRGAKSGAKSALELLPTLCGLTLGISMLKASGIIDGLVTVLSPILEKTGFPAECIPLLIIRPISGSGSLTVLEQLFGEYHPDSIIGNTASIFASSTETVLYTFSIYFGAVKAKKAGYALPLALLGLLLAAWLSAIAARLYAG